MSTSYDKQALAEAARAASKQAYAPYSNFPVGAALLTSTGEIITACNVENASYGLTMCAERAAIFQAVAQGHRSFQAIAISTPGAGSPCGACRQVLREFGTDLEIILADENGQIARETTLATLLPDSFGPDSLEPKK